jgi:hypothetical protein
MSSIHLTRENKKSFYRKEYYHGKKKIRLFFWSFMLIFFLFGIFFFKISNSLLGNPIAAVSIISVCIYFTFQPFFWFYLKKREYAKDDFFDVLIEDGKIHIQSKDSLDSSITQLSTFREILERQEYFILRFQNYTAIYLPNKQLIEAEREELRRFIK